MNPKLDTKARNRRSDPISAPRLSVLLPCRNAARTLPETIDSLRNQTLDHIEVIAVDDASSDQTPRILAAWADADPRVRVRSTLTGSGPPATGIVAALNLAAHHARTSVLARMDADDIAHPDRLRRQLAHLETHPGLAGCGTTVELFADPPDETGSGYQRYQRWINAIETPDDVDRNALIECPIAHPTLTIRRSVLVAVGGYRDMGWPEDYDLILRLLAAGARLANVGGADAKPLLRWRVRPHRHSLTSDTYSPAAFRRCRVHFLRHAFLPVGRPVTVWGAGKVGKPLARELIRQGTPVAAFVDLDPRKIGQEIHGAPVLGPDAFAAFAPGGARPYVLAAVGSPGVRHQIRTALEDLGFRELVDFRFCA